MNYGILCNFATLSIKTRATFAVVLVCQIVQKWAHFVRWFITIKLVILPWNGGRLLIKPIDMLVQASCRIGGG